MNQTVRQYKNGFKNAWSGAMDVSNPPFVQVIRSGRLNIDCQGDVN